MLESPAGFASGACFQIAKADSRRNIRYILAAEKPIGWKSMPGISPDFCEREDVRICAAGESIMSEPLSPIGVELGPIWDDKGRVRGQLFMMGFEGTEVTPQIKH